MIRIGVIGSGSGGQKASYYRVVKPFHDLQKAYPQKFHIEFIRPPYTSLTLMGIDVLFAHKPIEKDFLEVARFCRHLGIKIIFDYDDDLFNLPTTHYAYTEYQDKKLSALIAYCADAITVSTPKLKEIMSAIVGHDRIKVVPNYVDVELHGAKRSDELIVGWRGGHSHLKEIDAVAPVLSHAAKKYPLKVIGVDSSEIEGDYDFVPRCSPFNYLDMIKKLGVSLWVNYWNHDVFSQSKSNIIWHEATLTGGAVIARSGFDCFDSLPDGCVKLFDSIEEAKALVDSITLSEIDAMNRESMKIVAGQKKRSMSLYKSAFDAVLK